MRSGNQYTPEDVRAALQFLDPGTDRESWVRVLMAGKAAGLTEDDAITWSATASNYKNEREVSSVWRSIKPEGGIGTGTLFHLARAAGWKGHRAAESTRPPRRHGPPSKAPQATDTGRRVPLVAEAWAACAPATSGHPYVVAKEGRPDGLRVVREGWRAGWLVVPVVPLGQTEPVSLQYIAPPEVAAKLKAEGKSSKQNHKGAQMAGVFIVGELEQGGTAYLCEGIGQAWACWRATGRAAVVCFGWGRFATVAAELRQRDTSARLVLVPDKGKEADAEAIAREVAAQWVALPEGWPQNADVGDFAQREGAEALEALLSAPQSPAQRFRLLGSADLHALPPLAWRVRGVLPAHGLASFYGPSGSGKTFLVLDAAAAIAEGAVWFGYRVKSAPVVYCALEGEAGFRVRVAAWEQAKGRTLPAGLRLVLQPFKLTEPQDVEDLAAAVLTAGAGAVVILDTLNRAAPEADENSSADMGRILEAAKALQGLTSGLVVLVHHTGKDATKGMRGHSSLFAALDAAVEVTREGDRREWKVAKAKDGQDGAAHPFRLEVVDLGEDDASETVTSCVVTADDSPESLTRPKGPKGGNQKLVLDALGELLRKSATFGRAGAPPVRTCVELETAVETIAPRLTCEPKRQKERVRQALTGLLSSGVVTCREGWLWLP